MQHASPSRPWISSQNADEDPHSGLLQRSPIPPAAIDDVFRSSLLDPQTMSFPEPEHQQRPEHNVSSASTSHDPFRGITMAYAGHFVRGHTKHPSDTSSEDAGNEDLSGIFAYAPDSPWDWRFPLPVDFGALQYPGIPPPSSSGSLTDAFQAWGGVSLSAPAPADDPPSPSAPSVHIRSAYTNAVRAPLNEEQPSSFGAPGPYLGASFDDPAANDPPQPAPNSDFISFFSADGKETLVEAPWLDARTVDSAPHTPVDEEDPWLDDPPRTPEESPRIAHTTARKDPPAPLSLGVPRNKDPGPCSRPRDSEARASNRSDVADPTEGLLMVEPSRSITPIPSHLASRESPLAQTHPRNDARAPADAGVRRNNETSPSSRRQDSGVRAPNQPDVSHPTGVAPKRPTVAIALHSSSRVLSLAAPCAVPASHFRRGKYVDVLQVVLTMNVLTPKDLLILGQGNMAIRALTKEEKLWESWFKLLGEGKLREKLKDVEVLGQCSRRDFVLLSLGRLCLECKKTYADSVYVPLMRRICDQCRDTGDMFAVISKSAAIMKYLLTNDKVYRDQLWAFRLTKKRYYVSETAVKEVVMRKLDMSAAELETWIVRRTHQLEGAIKAKQLLEMSLTNRARVTLSTGWLRVTEDGAVAHDAVGACAVCKRAGAPFWAAQEVLPESLFVEHVRARHVAPLGAACTPGCGDGVARAGGRRCAVCCNRRAMTELGILALGVPGTEMATVRRKQKEQWPWSVFVPCVVGQAPLPEGFVFMLGQVPLPKRFMFLPHET